ncbi:MAG: DNA/RNA non-specific endonuclease [Pirellulales bacterium]
MMRTSALLLLLSMATPGEAEERPERRFGLPPGRTLERSSYIVVWNGRTRCPDVVAEYLTIGRLVGTAKRDGLSFRSDPEIPREFRPVLAAYSNSGFDFGHLAPAANHKRTAEELAETFLITNACPQLHALNAGPWLQLEGFARYELADNPTVNELWIYSGPAWWAPPGETLQIQRIDQVWVPTHFWKVLITDAKAAWAWLLPADASGAADPNRYAVSINTIETVTGLDLLDALPDDEEDRLEAQLHYQPDGKKR